MTVTAIVVMNQEQKLTTTKNPLLRVSEVEEFISTYTKDCDVFIDIEQFNLRLGQAKKASKIYLVTDEDPTNKEMMAYENLHPKAAEMLIKHHFSKKDKNITVFLSPSQLNRIKGCINRTILVTINNTSKETAVISKEFTAALDSAVIRKKLSMSTWAIKQSEEEHKRRYSVKIYE